MNFKWFEDSLGPLYLSNCNSYCMLNIYDELRGLVSFHFIERWRQNGLGWGLKECYSSCINVNYEMVEGGRGYCHLNPPPASTPIVDSFRPLHKFSNTLIHFFLCIFFFLRKLTPLHMFFFHRCL